MERKLFVEIVVDDKKGTPRIKGFREETKKSIQSLREHNTLGTRVATRLHRAWDAAHKGISNSTRTLGRSLINLKSIAVTALAGWGLKRLADSFVDAANTSEQYAVRLGVLLRSTEEGARMFSAMADYASRVPFEFEKVMGAATALSGVMKGGVNEVKGWMPLIGDLAAVTGLTIEETTSQVIRMYSAGAAAADMFRERGVLSMMGFQAGVKYSAEETRKIMMDQWNKAGSQFRGATERLAGTWGGLTSMFKDQWFQFRNAVMQSGPFQVMKDLARTALDELNRLKKEGKLDEWARKTAVVILDSLYVIARGFEKLMAVVYRFRELVASVAKIFYELKMALNARDLSALEKASKLDISKGQSVTEMAVGKDYYEKYLKTSEATEDRRRELENNIRMYNEVISSFQDMREKNIESRRKLNDAIESFKGWIDKAKAAPNEIPGKGGTSTSKPARSNISVGGGGGTLGTVATKAIYEPGLWEYQAREKYDVMNRVYEMDMDYAQKAGQIYENLRADMADMDKDSYKLKYGLLEKQYEEYKAFLDDTSDLDKWYYLKKEELDRNYERKYGTLLQRLRVRYKDFQDENINATSIMYSVIDSGAQNMQSQLSDILFNAFTGNFDEIKFSWDSLWDSMLKTAVDMIAQIAVEWAIGFGANTLLPGISGLLGGLPVVGEISGVFGNLLGGVTDVIGGVTDVVGDVVGGIGDVVGDVVGGIGDFFGDLFHQGGTIGQSGTAKRQIPITAYTNAPRAHYGLKVNEVPIIGKKGERVLSEAETEAYENNQQGNQYIFQGCVFTPDDFNRWMGSSIDNAQQARTGSTYQKVNLATIGIDI